MRRTPMWEMRRGELNHDWLKNKFLNALDAFLERLSSVHVDETRIREYLVGDLPQWGDKREEVIALVEAFQSEMCPSELIEEPPLSHMNEATKEWLRSLVDGLWMSRYPVSEWVSEAWRDLAKVDSAYRDVIDLAKEHAAGDIECLRARADKFGEFRSALGSLSEALSSFPHRVMVT